VPALNLSNQKFISVLTKLTTGRKQTGSRNKYKFVVCTLRFGSLFAVAAWNTVRFRWPFASVSQCAVLDAK